MNKDPYKYFRIEARELLEALMQGVLALEKGAGGGELVARLLRQAHTLKGAARVVKQSRISELSHEFENVLTPYREGQTPVSREDVGTLLRLVDGMTEQLQALQGPAPQAEQRPAATPSPTAPPDETLESLRVGVAEMDGLLHQASEAAIHVSALRKDVADLDEAMGGSRELAERSGGERLHAAIVRLRRSLVQRIEKAERELAGVTERTRALRLMPAGVVFAQLHRIARDVADAQGKRVRFESAGGEHRLDSHVLRAIRDALVHVVRNAVVHGIEPESERAQAGKDSTGLVQIRVERRGERLGFVCRDDGRGIHVEQIRRFATAKGLLPQEQAEQLDLKQAVMLLMRSGVSTSGMVTELAGRGVGLDVVRQTAADFNGDVRIDSEPSRGTSVEIQVPVSIESLSVLEVEVDGTVAAVPFESVQRTLRISEKELGRAPGGETVLFEGQNVPFVPLGSVLGIGGSSAAQRRSWSALIVRSRAGAAALGVNHVVRRTTVVMRALPASAGRNVLVAGASFDAEGNPQLVLDPAGLVQASSGRQMIRPTAPANRPPVLVVDDSLTTRMLEQSILETAGYDVDLADSGEEAMRKAKQRRYAIFVVDVEMPGMDGFGFIERTQADPALRSVPAILVTSRASAEDRERGRQVGAKAYVVKSEFDQGRLLSLIRGLVE